MAPWVEVWCGEAATKAASVRLTIKKARKFDHDPFGAQKVARVRVCVCGREEEEEEEEERARAKCVCVCVCALAPVRRLARA